MQGTRVRVPLALRALVCLSYAESCVFTASVPAGPLLGFS